MSDPASGGDELLVAVEGQCAMVRLCGRGSFKNAPSLKRFCTAAIDRGATRIVLDMDACHSMDSTFMGVLAGLAMRLRHGRAGQVVAINLSAKTASLLETLGLTRLIDAYQVGEGTQQLITCLDGIMNLSSLGAGGESDKVTLDTMLNAHRALIDASPGNLVKFKDVVTYLEQDLKQMED